MKAFSADVVIKPGLVVKFFSGGFKVVQGELKIGTPEYDIVSRTWFDAGDGCIHTRKAS